MNEQTKQRVREHLSKVMERLVKKEQSMSLFRE